MKRVYSRKITPVPQVAAGDCGLACLAMVLGAHGSKLGIQDLRGRLNTSINGISVSRILHTAAQFRLSGRAVRVNLANLSALKLPAILHWNFNHYVVLERLTRSGAVVIDPASGRRHVPLDAISDQFTGIALEFTPMPSYEKVRRILRSSLSDLWTSVSGVRRSVMLIASLSVAVQILVLISPLLFSVIIDSAVPLQSSTLLWSIFGAIVLASLLGAAADVLRRFLLLSLGTELAAQVSHNLVNHLLRLPYGYFQQRRLSDLLTRVDSVRVLKDALTEGAVPILVDGAFSILTIIIIITVFPPVAAVTIGFVLLFTAIKIITYPSLRARSEEVIDRQADEQAALMETIRGMQVVKTMNAEHARLSSWHGSNTISLNTNRRAQELTSLLASTRSVITNLDFATVAALCAALVIKSEITIGVLFAVVALRQQFQDRVYPLIDRCFEFRLVRMRLDRLTDIVAQPPEIPDDTERLGSGFVTRGEIRLCGIKYRYAEDLSWVIDNLTLEVNPGEFIAINGRSGGGKSTLIRLLVGLLRPEEGTIHIDGRLLDCRGLEGYRGDIAVVMQDDQLFSGTIFDNISGFDPSADADEVYEAARLAHVASDIEQMPMGYFSFIGDMGSSLSGGQQQRLLLARALYRKPRILFLDEGTANLDPEREGKIIATLKGLNITTVCVAHRSKTLEEADRVFELRDGQLFQMRPARSTVYLNTARSTIEAF